MRNHVYLLWLKGNKEIHWISDDIIVKIVEENIGKGRKSNDTEKFYTRDSVTIRQLVSVTGISSIWWKKYNRQVPIPS